MNTETNCLYVNNTGSDLGVYHAEIAAALRTTGTLPEDLADLFTVTTVSNLDGSPRYIINAA